jgi:hypothetical protein
MPPQQPWWSYMMIALWPLWMIAFIVCAVALWRIGTALRRIVFLMERPPALASLAAMSASRVQAGRSPAIVFEPPPPPPPAHENEV